MNTQNLLLGRKSWLFVGVVCLLLISTPPSAQGSCGDVVVLDSSTGAEESRAAIGDCNDPFVLIDGDRFSNVEIGTGGNPITDGMTLTLDSLPVDLSPTATFDDNTLLTSIPSFTLYYHVGDDYVNDKSHTADAVGTYTLVHEIAAGGPGGNLDNVFAPMQWLRNLFITTAHAQFGGFGPLERTAVTFSVALTEPVLVEEEDNESARTQSGSSSSSGSRSATRVGDRLLKRQVLGISTSRGSIELLDTNMLVTNALEQLTKVLQMRKSLTESEAQTLTQMLSAISLILSDQVDVGN